MEWVLGYIVIGIILEVIAILIRGEEPDGFWSKVAIVLAWPTWFIVMMLALLNYFERKEW